jgi:hypothetical protein
LTDLSQFVSPFTAAHIRFTADLSQLIEWAFPGENLLPNLGSETRQGEINKPVNQAAISQLKLVGSSNYDNLINLKSSVWRGN